MTKPQVTKAVNTGQVVLSAALLIIQILGLLKGRKTGNHAGTPAAS